MNLTSKKSGDNSEEVTPVPISNTVVKLLSADDTWWEAAWESRTLPVFYYLDLRMIEIKNWARSVKRVRASFLFAQIFYNCNTEWGQHLLSFFILATSLLSESMVSFDPLCGIAARKETMKLAGLRLRVIWTLPVFYYLDLHIIEIKNCALVCLFSYLNLGKIERKNWARSVKRVRASFLLP